MEPHPDLEALRQQPDSRHIAAFKRAAHVGYPEITRRLDLQEAAMRRLGSRGRASVDSAHVVAVVSFAYDETGQAIEICFPSNPDKLAGVRLD